MRVPAQTFPPGEYLRDELDARGWTQIEFAEIINRPTRLVNEIIAGKRGITPETANELAAALGTSPQLWMNLETAHQLSKARPASDAIARKARLRRKFPLREMIKRGWIEATDDLDCLEERIRSFFLIQTLEQEIHFPHAARRKNKDEPLTGIQQAWLFRVKQLADAMPTKPYSRPALQSALSHLEALTAEPEESRHVAKILAGCGVRFVIVEPFPSSKIDGVCFWTNAKSPVIGMTLRFDRNDNFWFVLRHEIEHILRDHAKQGAILDEDLAVGGRNVSEEEAVANSAAEDFCTPKNEMDDFIARVTPYFSEQKIVRFAKRIGRHPGLVVGQLQNRLERPDLLNKLKAKIRKHVTSAALTDGWGATAPL